MILSADKEPFEGLAIRDRELHDESFIVLTWLKSHAENAKIARHVHESNQAKVVNELLKKEGVCVKVACSAAMPKTIVGWACAEGESLHYAYVSYDIRNMGIARLLIKAVLGGYPERIDVTHRFQHSWPPKSHRFVFNPYRLGIVA